MRRSDAAKRGIHSMADLGPASATLRLAGDYEIFGRPEWAQLQATYRLQFPEQRIMDPSLMLSATSEGTVDVVTAYTTDGRLVPLDLVALPDPAGALPAYDAWILAGPRLLQDPRALTPLQALAGRLPTAAMQALNHQVETHQAAAATATATAAAAWLDGL